MKKQIGLSATVKIRATRSGPARFTVVAYRGGELRLAGWDAPVVIDLTGLRFARKVLANLDHDMKRRVGHVDDHRIERGAVILAGVISAVTPWAKEVRASAKRGYQWDASVEVSTDENKTEEVNPGKTVSANGRQFSGPLYLVRSGVLTGFAFVTRGADAETEVSIAAEAEQTLERLYDRRQRLRRTILSTADEGIAEMCLDQLEKVCSATAHLVWQHGAAMGISSQGD